MYEGAIDAAMKTVRSEAHRRPSNLTFANGAREWYHLRTYVAFDF